MTLDCRLNSRASIPFYSILWPFLKHSIMFSWLILHGTPFFKSSYECVLNIVSCHPILVVYTEGSSSSPSGKILQHSVLEHQLYFCTVCTVSFTREEHLIGKAVLNTFIASRCFKRIAQSSCSTLSARENSLLMPKMILLEVNLRQFHPFYHLPPW
jgi:hypothetical protein